MGDNGVISLMMRELFGFISMKEVLKFYLLKKRVNSYLLEWIQKAYFKNDYRLD